MGSKKPPKFSTFLHIKLSNGLNLWGLRKRQGEGNQQILTWRWRCASGLKLSLKKEPNSLKRQSETKRNWFQAATTSRLAKGGWKSSSKEGQNFSPPTQITGKAIMKKNKSDTRAFLSLKMTKWRRKILLKSRRNRKTDFQKYYHTAIISMKTEK